MGICFTKNDIRKSAQANDHMSREASHLQNIHQVNPDIKVHTVVSAELDFDHESAMRLPLGEVSDEQLLAEVARRKLDLHDRITDAMVKVGGGVVLCVL